MSPVPAEPFRRRPGPAARLRADFLTGLAVVLPAGLTAMLVAWAVGLVDHRVRPLLPDVLPFDEAAGAGLLVFVAVTTLAGAFARGLAGRRLLAAMERLMARVPVVRTIHAALRQMVETMVERGDTAFRRICLVEFPDRGTWVIGFVVREAAAEAAARTGSPGLLAVFVPTVPNPTTGFVLHVPAAEARMLEMTVEEGLKLVMSAGLADAPPAPTGPRAARR